MQPQTRKFVLGLGYLYLGETDYKPSNDWSGIAMAGFGGAFFAALDMKTSRFSFGHTKLPFQAHTTSHLHHSPHKLEFEWKLHYVVNSGEFAQRVVLPFPSIYFKRSHQIYTM